MFDDLSISEQLGCNAAILLAFVNNDVAQFEMRSAALDDLIHDAEAREHRRAAFNRRDAACYRLGSAFEPLGGLDLDPVFLAGWLTAGTTGLLLLTRVAIANNSGTIVDHLRLLAASPAGRQIREWGVWAQWSWLKDLREAETEGFRRSKNFHKSGWRQKPPTARQRYCIAKLCEWLQTEQQIFSTRWEALCWIEAQGGNPRFRTAPARPDLTAALEAFS